MHARIRTLCLVAFAALTPLTATKAQELIVQVPEITVAAAVQLVDSCIAYSAERNLAMAVAVVNPAGELMHFHARQGASPTAPTTAQRKAVTAARWRRSTGELSDRVNSGYNRGPEYLGDFPFYGGTPIIQGAHTIGAIGAAGPGNPEECSESAVRAVFGDSVEIGRPDTAVGN